jgi:hypothetical protein
MDTLDKKDARMYLIRGLEQSVTSKTEGTWQCIRPIVSTWFGPQFETFLNPEFNVYNYE